MYVGDNPQKDFAVQKVLPVKTVKVNFGGLYQDKPYLDEILPWASISDIAEVKELLKDERTADRL